MAKKGETYAQVGVDLARWAEDYMRINNFNQSELANRLRNGNGEPINRARITNMVQGTLNTLKFLQIVVESIYQGDYSCMGRYTMNEDGDAVLAMLNLRKSLKGRDKGRAERLRQLILKAWANHSLDKIDAAIKALEK